MMVFAAKQWLQCCGAHAPLKEAVLVCLWTQGQEVMIGAKDGRPINTPVAGTTKPELE